MLRRLLFGILIVFFTVIPAAANELYLYHYNDGEKKYSISDEVLERYNLISIEAIEKASDVLKSSQLTLEQRAQQTKLLTDEERMYSTLWGIPRTEDITQTEALHISYAALQDIFLLDESELVSLFPVFTFEVTDPKAFLWCIKFIPSTRNENIMYMVKLYSKTGCLAEISKGNSIG